MQQHMQNVSMADRLSWYLNYETHCSFRFIESFVWPLFFSHKLLSLIQAMLIFCSSNFISRMVEVEILSNTVSRIKFLSFRYRLVSYIERGGRRGVVILDNRILDDISEIWANFSLLYPHRQTIRMIYRPIYHWYQLIFRKMSRIPLTLNGRFN